MSNNILTRDEFYVKLLGYENKMAKDKKLQNDALDVLGRADHYKWIHQTKLFGEPILNIPYDMFALQ